MITSGCMKRPKYCIKCDKLFLAYTKCSRVCLPCYEQSSTRARSVNKINKLNK